VNSVRLRDMHAAAGLLERHVMALGCATSAVVVCTVADVHCCR
jgi:hypothetical protein